MMSPSSSAKRAKVRAPPIRTPPLEAIVRSQRNAPVERSKPRANSMVSRRAFDFLIGSATMSSTTNGGPDTNAPSSMPLLSRRSGRILHRSRPVAGSKRSTSPVPSRPPPKACPITVYPSPSARTISPRSPGVPLGRIPREIPKSRYQRIRPVKRSNPRRRNPSLTSTRSPARTGVAVMLEAEARALAALDSENAFPSTESKYRRLNNVSGRGSSQIRVQSASRSASSSPVPTIFPSSDSRRLDSMSCRRIAASESDRASSVIAS